MPARPLRFGIKMAQMGGSYAEMREAWLEADRLGFDTAWGHDHLLNQNDIALPEDEGWTVLTALLAQSRRIRGGLMVTANTFRHPSLLAKIATTVDRISNGRVEVGLGAGWFEEEHGPFGIELPPIGERISRMVSAVDTIQALFGPDAAGLPGVTRDDPYYPLKGATNLPAPLTPGGPPLFLGGQGPRGIRLAARAAQGWLLPGTEAGDDDYFRSKRDLIVGALEDAGRDPATFELVGQVFTGTDAPGRARALVQARRIVAAGATEIVLGMPAALGPAGLDDVHRDLLLPLRDAAA